MKRLTQFIIAITTLLALPSCADSNGAEEQVQTKSNLQVEAYKVVPQSFNNVITTTANLMAEEQVELMAPTSAQVLAIYFKEGQWVTKGEKIIRLDDRSWKAQLIGLKAELKTAKKDYDRKKQLLSVGGSSQEEIDNSFSKIEILKSQMQQLQVNIDLANVIAPFSGQLGLRDFSEGAFLKQGDLITTLSANKQLKVGFTLAQNYTNSIEIGKKLLVTVGLDTLEAEIYAISPIVDQQTRTLKVRAFLDSDTKKKILPGAFAEILLTTDLLDDALLIPTQAVVPSINEQTVYLSKNGKAVKQVVTLGNRTADMVHILTGIKEGDVVLTTGLLAVKDGMSISIKQSK